MRVDDMREPLRAGSDLQDHVEALARLDRTRVGELPTQTLHFDEVGIECGDDLRVHSASWLMTAPHAQTVGSRSPRTRCTNPPGETGVAYFFFLALDFLSFLSFLSFFATMASSTVCNRRAARER